VIAYKFLAADGKGMFTRFAWPLPNGGPGAWVDAEIDPCRSGVHACRIADMPYWVSPALYEIELDGTIVDQSLKLVAERGRLVRRVDEWSDQVRDEYSRACIARAAELADARGMQRWAPPPDGVGAGPALLGFIAARIAEETGGIDAYRAERRRQADWLRERLGL